MSDAKPAKRFLVARHASANGKTICLTGVEPGGSRHWSNQKTQASRLTLADARWHVDEDATDSIAEE